ncbi:MAG: hypothetical protein KI793_30275 [Rivularia sp. (in: Bacteria)]|nr:hypothetical protein [Rivularia sp. MS3]
MRLAILRIAAHFSNTDSGIGEIDGDSTNSKLKIKNYFEICILYFELIHFDKKSAIKASTMR